MGNKKTLHVNLAGGRDYDILFERGLLAHAGAEIRKVFPKGRAAVITDSNVAPLYGETLIKALQTAGFETKLLTFPAGEASKTMDTVVELYDGLLSETPFSVTRGDFIVALGGGVTGDMAGFVAATLLRGIPFVQIPTTLLSQVDSSVGGKVAVDLKQGKNLAGAFHQPKLVLIDPDTLDTLTDRVFYDGLSEVIKYGVLGEPELFSLLEAHPGRTGLQPLMDEILYTCCDCKRRVVEADEFDTGGRMVLNLGHTIGHAYEKLGNYETYMHGEAVACGMYAIAKIGEKVGVTAPGTAERIAALLTANQLPHLAAKLPAEALSRTLSLDKKADGQQISLVFPQTIGKTLLQKTELHTFSEWVAAFSETEGATG